MEQILIIIQVLVSVFLVVLVLVQQGKGATMGAAFGSGASSTVFGSQGSGGFLLKLTALFAALFFISSLALGYMATMHAKAQQKAQAVHMPAQTVPVQKAASPAKKPAKKEPAHK